VPAAPPPAEPETVGSEDVAAILRRNAEANAQALALANAKAAEAAEVTPEVSPEPKPKRLRQRVVEDAPAAPDLDGLL
jgi:hypothetical protein